jgi:hypothetical protein
VLKKAIVKKDHKKCGKSEFTRSTLNKLFNLLMVYDAVWATIYESSYLIRFAIPLCGINYIPAHICFYLQMPAVFFAAQLITMFFIAWERLLAVLFPIW